MKLTKIIVQGGGADLCAVISALSLLSALPALAEWNESTHTYDTTGYVTLTASESGDVFSFAADTSWDPKIVPQSGYKFFVPANKSLRRDKTNNDLTFKGDVLAVAGAMTFPTIGRTSWNPIHLLDGAKFNCYMYKTTFGGSAVVYSSQSNPATVRFDVNTGREGVYLVDFTLSGAEWTGFMLAGCRSGSSGIFSWTGDASEFYGTLTVDSQQREDKITFNPRGVAFGGTVVLTNEVTLAPGTGGFSASTLTLRRNAGMSVTPAGTTTAGTISLADGSRIVLDAAATAATAPIVATDGLNVAGMVDVTAYTNATPVAMDELSLALLSVPEDRGAIDLDAFRLDASLMTIPDVPHFTLSTNSLDGKSQLVLNRRRLVTTAGGSDGENVSTFTNSQKFSDHELPHGNADYLFKNSVRLPVNTNEYEFAGETMTLNPDIWLQTSGCADFRAKRLNMFEGSVVVGYAGNPFVITANEIVILPSSSPYVMFRAYKNLGLRLNAELSGTGDVCFQFRGKYMDTGYVELVKPATNLSGRVMIACQGFESNTADYGCSGTNYMRVKTGDARNVGGPMAAFTYDGIRIRDYGILHLTNTTTFAETTRGMFLDGEARIEVDEGKTVTFLPQTTFGGRLRKLGDGTLALGGPVRFSLGDTLGNTPVAGTNVLQVVAGAVKPVAKTGYDGLELRFLAGTKLVLDAVPSDPDVATYGLYDAAWSNPFVIYDMDALPVEVQGECPAGDFTLGICTVPSGLAETMRSMFAVARPDADHGVVTLAVRDNNDGTSTVTASFTVGGLTVIFR